MNLTIKHSNIIVLLGIILPLIYIIDNFLVDTSVIFNSEILKIHRLTFPFFELIYFIVAAWFLKDLKVKKITFAIVLLIVIHSLFFSFHILIAIIVTINILIYLNLTGGDSKRTFFWYLISYTTLSILIIFYRYLFLNVTMTNIRNGINIWGGLDLIAMWLLYFSFLQIKYHRTEVYILIVALMLSFIYISRTGIFITVGLLIINLRKLKIKSILILLFFLLVIFFYIHAYLEIFLLRFEIINDYTLETSRGYIWDFTYRLISNNFFWGIGLGDFILLNPVGFSNSHNFIMQIFVDFGFIAGIPILIYVLRPIAVQLKRNNINSAINYLLIIVLLTVGGSTLIQTGGVISAQILFGMILING